MFTQTTEQAKCVTDLLFSFLKMRPAPSADVIVMGDFIPAQIAETHHSPEFTHLQTLTVPFDNPD